MDGNMTFTGLVNPFITSEPILDCVIPVTRKGYPFKTKHVSVSFAKFAPFFWAGFSQYRSRKSPLLVYLDNSNQK
ncbi:MAG: hypothetical protein AB7T22_11480 [Calditrichaceae bacterium]